MNEYVPYFNSIKQSEPFSLCMTGVNFRTPGYAMFSVKKKRNTSAFEYVVSGKGNVFCNGKEFAAKAGDILYFPRGCDYMYCSDKSDPWVKIWITSFGSLVPNMMRAYYLNETIHFHDAPFYPIFKKALKLCRDGNLPTDEFEASISLLIHELIINLHRHTTQAKAKTSKPSDAEIIRAYLDDHIYDKVTMNDLSALIFRCESQMIRIFKNAYGTTPYNYLLDIRIITAKHMLAETDMSVKEIAFKLGYADEHYFSYLFKQKTGQTPTTYKNSVSSQK